MTSYAEAIESVFLNYIEPLIQDSEPHNFRVNIFWKEEIDKILNHYEPFLMNVFLNSF